MMIHTFTVTARYAETDLMGVIHHSVYPIWAEAARTDLMKQMGYSYSQIEKDGVMLPVVEMLYRYKSPAFYEDQVTIRLAVTELTNRKVRLDYELLREDTLCVVGYTQHIYMDAISRKAIKINDKTLQKFQKFYEPEFRVFNIGE